MSPTSPIAPSFDLEANPVRRLALPSSGSASLWRMFLLETRYDLLKLLRIPAFAIPALLFPALFYVFFGLAFGAERAVGGTTVGTYMLATYGAFGVLGITLFTLGVGVATERGQGWMLFKKATPLPVWIHFAARLAVAMIFSLVLILLLFSVGAIFGGVRLPSLTWLALAGSLLVGALPFTALGLALGYLSGPNSAPGIINLIYMPLAFASGYWIPIHALPDFLQKLAPFLPTYHYGQLALDTLGAAQEKNLLLSLGVLLVTALLFSALAYLGYRRDEGATYG